MVDFDAELYLRMLGERALLADDVRGRRPDSPLDEPAAALIAVGAIERPLAERLLDDYGEAIALRSEHRRFYHGRRRSSRRRPGRLSTRTTRIVDREVAFARGRLRLRDLTIGPGGAHLRFRWTREQRGGPPAQSVFGAWSSATPSLPAIVDDRGRALTVSPGSGGGGDDTWEGTFELHGGPAVDVEWLEVEGTRIELRRMTAVPVVSVERLDDETPVERYLWRRLAAGDTPFHRAADLEPAIAALIAAGAVAPEDPLLTRARAVAAQMPDHPRHPHPARGSAKGRLPEPWRSLLQRVGRSDGPIAACVIGALTPPFDETQVALELMHSDATGFEVTFEVAPNVLHGTLDVPPLAWWARDDRGNHYLGAPNSWSGGDDHAEGTLRFWPALDPRAARVDFLPTAASARAVISISLGDAEQVAT